MTATIETNRLTLRPMRADDCARVVALLGDWDVVKTLSRVPHPYTSQSFEAWQGGQQAGFDAGTDFPFAIEEPHAGVVGCVGTHLREDGAFELGYWLGKASWGLGFATEAGHGLLAWMQGERPSAHFKASHFEDNPASGRVLEKLGFVYTGETLTVDSLARGHSVAARAMIYAPTRKERP
jgi:RimJ/RimL family protein N-acetyltransferase